MLPKRDLRPATRIKEEEGRATGSWYVQEQAGAVS